MRRNFEKVLFIGTGGGNDIYSILLAMMVLWEQGWRWHESAAAGVLSPFHEHAVKPTVWPNVYEVNENSARFIDNYLGGKEIGFIDATVARLFKRIPMYGVAKVLGLSLRSGSAGLAGDLRLLGQTYDFIVLVDLGGDIFYSGPSDTHVLSPMFDAMVLKGFVDSGVPGMLFEAGPGTDGEIDPGPLKNAIYSSILDVVSISEFSIKVWGELWEEWIKPVRAGRTVPLTIEAFHAPKSQDKIVRKYRGRAHIDDKRWYAYFEQTISTALCKLAYLVDPAKIRNPFAIECSSPLDWFYKAQVKIIRTNCELNLEYLETPAGLVQFLTPSPLFERYEKIQQIVAGLQNLRAGSCLYAYMFPQDWEMIEESLPDDLVAIKDNDSVLVSIKCG
jgi:hypothetical protein